MDDPDATPLAPVATRSMPMQREALVRLGAGQVLAERFRVTRFIGQGGMGDVYQAEDMQLGERVALKTVRPEITSDPRMMARFKQEIQLAKRVTHPNVCRIHDLGRHADSTGEVIFLTMELLDGETLSQRLRLGPMSTSEALFLLRQMAAALDAAHASGIVHRDFKSPNVMLVSATGGTRAVVSDFGLARLIERSGQDLALTRTGEVCGTPDYMAPEQVMGEESGPAADLYALGVVAFEMVTGARPFRGGSPMAVAMKRLQEPPSKPSGIVPGFDPGWERAILRCLERQPGDRFPSGAEFIRALETGETARLPAKPRRISRRALAAGAAGIAAAAAGAGLWPLARRLGRRQVSLAVLPMNNPDAETRYLSDGLTEDLINGLGRVQSLSVISRGSVFAYDGPGDPQQAGRRFRADIVLSGTVRGKPDMLTIGVELVEVSSNRRLWGQQYKRKESELAAVRDDVSQEVLRALGVSLTAEQRKQMARRYSANSDAEQFYKKGRFFWNLRTQEGFRKAIEMYRQAIAADPSYALAYSGLADCYAMQSGVVPPREAFPRAEEAAAKALALDDSLAEAHASIAFIRLYYSWNWLESEKEYRRAIELNPSYAPARSMYAIYLAVMGRFDEAIAESKRAQELDPLSGAVATGLGRLYSWSGQYGNAIAQFRKVLELHPDFAQTRISLGEALRARGELKGAVAEFEKAAGAGPSTDAGMLADLAYALGSLGRREQIDAILARMEDLSKKRYVSPYFQAVAWVARGDRERAFERLEQGYNDRTFPMIYLKLDGKLKGIQADPRYGELVRKVGL